MNGIPLYLLALIVAIAKTPTNIFQICAWNVGTLEIEPWRSKLPTAIATRTRSLLTRLRTLFSPSGGLPAVAVLAAILVLLVAVPHVHASIGPVLAMAPV